MSHPLASLNGRPRAVPERGPGVLRLNRTDRLLVFAPHPDDDTLALGGVLRQARSRNASVRVIYVTSGENNPWAQRACELRWRIGPTEQRRWGRRREREALASLSQLGVPAEWATFLGWPDQKLTDLVLTGVDDAIERLAAEIARTRPTILFAPSLRDVHPDHSALGVMIRLALHSLGSLAPPISLAYAVHVRRAGKPPGAYSIALGTDEIERKRQALLCHQSQLRLRRGFVLAFGRRPESFDAIEDDRPAETGRLIRNLEAAPDRLHVAIERPLRMRLGPTELLILSRSSNGKSRVLSVPLELGSQPVIDRQSRRIVETAKVTQQAGRYEVCVPGMPAHAEGAHAYLKLDQPHARRWGFFDHAGWQQVALSRAVTGAREWPDHQGVLARDEPAFSGLRAATTAEAPI